MAVLTAAKVQVAIIDLKLWFFWTEVSAKLGRRSKRRGPYKLQLISDRLFLFNKQWGVITECFLGKAAPIGVHNLPPPSNCVFKLGL